MLMPQHISTARARAVLRSRLSARISARAALPCLSVHHLASTPRTTRLRRSRGSRAGCDLPVLVFQQNVRAFRCSCSCSLMSHRDKSRNTLVSCRTSNGELLHESPASDFSLLLQPGWRVSERRLVSQMRLRHLHEHILADQLRELHRGHACKRDRRELLSAMRAWQI